HQASLADTFSWTRGSQYLKIGGSVARHASGGDGTEFGGAFTLGQFTINPAVTAPIAQLTLANVQRYTQTFDFGAGTYRSSQWIYALFAQDKLRLTSDLSVDLGLRYDRQTFSDAENNLAPRVGFAWHPGGDARTAIRGGYGLYYTMLRANIDPNFRLGGPAGMLTYTATAGQLGLPSTLTAVPTSFSSCRMLP